MHRTLVIIGIVTLLAGLAWPWLSSLGLGRLPGDIALERDGFRVFFPLTTCVLVSAVFTLLWWLFRQLKGPSRLGRPWRPRCRRMGTTG